MKPRHILLVYISYEQETIKGSLYTLVINSICYRASLEGGGGGLVVLGQSDRSPFTSPLTCPDLIDPRPSTAAAW